MLAIRHKSCVRSVLGAGPGAARRRAVGPPAPPPPRKPAHSRLRFTGRSVAMKPMHGAGGGAGAYLPPLKGRPPRARAAERRRRRGARGRPPRAGRPSKRTVVLCVCLEGADFSGHTSPSRMGEARRRARAAPGPAVRAIGPLAHPSQAPGPRKAQPGALCSHISYAGHARAAAAARPRSAAGAPRGARAAGAPRAPGRPAPSLPRRAPRAPPWARGPPAAAAPCLPLLRRAACRRRCTSRSADPPPPA